MWVFKEDGLRGKVWDARWRNPVEQATLQTVQSIQASSKEMLLKTKNVKKYK